MKKLALLAVTLLVLARPAAAGETFMNLNQDYLPLDGHGFYVVDDAKTLDQWSVHGFLNFGYAYRPLEVSEGQSNHVRTGDLVDRQENFDIGGSVGLVEKGDFLKGLSVGFDIPVNILNDGLTPTFDHSIGSGGVGALRLQVKASFLEFGDSDLGICFGLKPFATFPTGGAYLDDNGSVTGGAMGLATANLWRIRLGVEGGYEFTPHIVLGDLSVRDRIRFGIALEGFILKDEAPWSDDKDATKHSLSIGAEGFGWTDAWKPLADDRTRPVEAFFFVRYENSLGMQLKLGYGNGINKGVGAPAERFMIQVGWTF